MHFLSACILEIGDNIVALLGLLETIEGHLGSWDVFLSVVHEKHSKSCELGVSFESPFVSSSPRSGSQSPL